MWPSHRRLAGPLLAALLAAALPAEAAYEDGLRAYHQGNYPVARAELEPLARQGDWRAQALLGRMYATGRGVRLDLVQAHYWLTLAAEAGDTESAALREGMALRMTPAQLAEAKRLERSAGAAPVYEAPVYDEPVYAAPAPGALGVANSYGDGGLGRAAIQDLQWQLALHGYDPGPADGAIGSRTSAAIRLYQQDAGLMVDGRPTRNLLDHLQYASPPVRNGAPGGGPLVAGVPGAGAYDPYRGDGAPDGYYDAAPADEAIGSLPWRDDTVGEIGPMAAYTRTVQEKLAARGYGIGPLDGRPGWRTRRAIQDYQSDAGLPVDGEVSLALVNHLMFIDTKP